jgi:hypothetical protein
MNTYSTCQLRPAADATPSDRPGSHRADKSPRILAQQGLPVTQLLPFRRAQTTKNPASPGFVMDAEQKLFNLGFLVHHMLAHYRVEFPDFHLFRHIALVLGGRIEVTGTGAGKQFDLVTHEDSP